MVLCACRIQPGGISSTRPNLKASAAGWGSTETRGCSFYGDRNNWFACYAFWLFEYYGHLVRKIMNGRRAKWVKEGRPFTREVPSFNATTYHASTAGISTGAAGTKRALPKGKSAAKFASAVK